MTDPHCWNCGSQLAIEDGPQCGACRDRITETRAVPTLERLESPPGGNSVDRLATEVSRLRQVLDERRGARMDAPEAFSDALAEALGPILGESLYDAVVVARVANGWIAVRPHPGTGVPLVEVSEEGDLDPGHEALARCLSGAFSDYTRCKRGGGIEVVSHAEGRAAG